MVKEERRWQGAKGTFGLGNRNGSSLAGIEGKRCPTQTEPGEKVGTCSRGEGPPVICWGTGVLFR